MRYINAQHRGDALWISFDRPEKLNILHPEDLSELRDAITDLASGVQAIVFTGAGQVAFSAGMNIEAFVGLTPARAHALIGDLAQVMQAIRRSPVVTVAAVNGYCLGAAFELALACDLRVVSPTATFGLPEIKVGVPSVIDAALLPGFVGLSKAREMVLTGDIYKLDQLPPGSIANVVADPRELAAAAESLLVRVARHPRPVTAAQRRLFDVWLNNPLEASVNASMTEFAKVFESQETHEQIARHHKRISG
jgi:enoyl-CoA hydratase